MRKCLRLVHHRNDEIKETIQDQSETETEIQDQPLEKEMKFSEYKPK